MTPEELLVRLEKYPRMYVPDGRYHTLVAFILGYDVALEGRFLEGFKEWCLAALGVGESSLNWPALIWDDVTERVAGGLPGDPEEEMKAEVIRLLKGFLSR
ncbi:hypothetical protein [Saccharothrix obliqua]|uniref:hypothetical protein n=1 Tax=Saccharothrix obliqua TaxID=2861747 RepID=UPI001C5D7B40|nr:hypothetical protein [Saccharothrix obliqua]MBW4717970.1 hypothetical protein [Saccharothrix obliqua]